MREETFISEQVSAAIEKFLRKAATEYYQTVSREKAKATAKRDRDKALLAWLRNEVKSTRVLIKLFNPAEAAHLEQEYIDGNCLFAEYKANIAKLAYLIHLGTIFADKRCTVAESDKIAAAVEKEFDIHYTPSLNWYAPNYSTKEDNK